MRRPLAVLLVAVLCGTGLVLASSPARGEGRAESAQAEALKRGEVLWKQLWGPGGKTCADCHSGGPNKMVSTRLKSYPKFDKALDRVVTAQQKLNQMIVLQGKGKALELGSEDLNALELYVSTLR